MKGNHNTAMNNKTLHGSEPSSRHASLSEDVYDPNPRRRYGDHVIRMPDVELTDDDDTCDYYHRIMFWPFHRSKRRNSNNEGLTRPTRPKDWLADMPEDRRSHEIKFFELELDRYKFEMENHTIFGRFLRTASATSNVTVASITGTIMIIICKALETFEDDATRLKAVIIVLYLMMGMAYAICSRPEARR